MKTTVLQTNVQKHMAAFVMVAAMFFGIISFAQTTHAQWVGQSASTQSNNELDNPTQSVNGQVGTQSSSNDSLGSMTRADLVALIQQLLQQLVERTSAPAAKNPGTTASNAGAQSGNTATGSFGVGSSVAADGNVRVRTKAGFAGDTLRVLPTGSGGKIVAGPESRNGERWWQIAYDGDQTGWSAESVLKLEGSRAAAPASNAAKKAESAATASGATYTVDDVTSVSSQYQSHTGETIYHITLTSGKKHTVNVDPDNTIAAEEFKKTGFQGDYLKLMFMAIRAGASVPAQNNSFDPDNPGRGVTSVSGQSRTGASGGSSASKGSQSSGSGASAVRNTSDPDNPTPVSGSAVQN